jgi:hypothetical protein
MIYITYKQDELDNSVVQNVWMTGSKNPKKSYSKFLVNKARTIFGIEINPNWFNIVSHINHNSNAKDYDYRAKEEKWNEFLKQHTLDFYIEKHLKGEKMLFKIIY